MQDLFFISLDQIQLARRFISSFMYKTGATFNTNKLHLPLSVMVGITNTGTTFLMAMCYITSESAESFEFVQHQLTKYVFFNCPEPVVIVADFMKGLGAAIAAKTQEDRKTGTKEGRERVAKQELFAELDGVNGGGLPASKSVVIINAEGHKEVTTLQLCEWHALEAIKRRLIHAGQYPKEKREELID